MECQIFSSMIIGPRTRQEDCIIDGGGLLQADLLSRKSRVSTGRLLLAVCDGMGGHKAGEKASRFACEQIEKFAWPDGITGPGVHRALIDIQSAAEQHLPANSGTTTAGLISDRERTIIFNAGDSRVYSITAESIKCLSHDHSLVQDLVDQCMMNAENAALHPFKHMIDFGIGPVFSHVWSLRDIYINEKKTGSSSTYLICTDGLTDILPDEQIHRLLAPAPLENGARLAEAAREKGLTDNTSFIIARINRDNTVD